MTLAALVYPHQLYADHPALVGVDRAVLIEEPLFFRQYTFHRQKLLLHRASMSSFAERLRDRGITVHRLASSDLAGLGIRAVQYVDPCDDWVGRRLTASLAQQGIAATVLEDPHFLTPRSIIADFTARHDQLFFTDFYIAQRKRLGILIEAGNKPLGGKWSYDHDNRKKLPRGVRIPSMPLLAESEHVREARAYTRRELPGALGSDDPFHYPIDHAGAAACLGRFVAERLALFGDYEDAISRTHDVLFHSVLTPLLNTGLLSPQQVIDAVLAEGNRISLNSREGFLRQVIGWREYVRLVYLTKGRQQRTRNFWGFTRPMPAAFYDGTTGIAPVDAVIQRVLRTGYCHHIERLMILGGFMLLCEINPDAVYQWFMELFVDAYDWVMVPNVYGMSQHADGGLMTTKPYISGSNYVLKMSDYARGPWCEVWDALYWRFVHEHADFFAANHRTAMMVRMLEKLGPKLDQHRRVADAFIEKLS